MDLLRSYSFFTILVALLASALVAAQNPSDTNRVSFTFFIHDNLLTDNPSAYALTLPILTASYGTYFGELVAFDDLITEGPDPKSPALGRGRGFYLFDDINYNGIQFVWTAEFRNDLGTLSFAGFDRNPDQTREISIIGGTGQYPAAIGYADITTYSIVGGAAVLNISLHVTYDNKTCNQYDGVSFRLVPC